MNDIKSFLIGFLSCLCLMLFMGYTPANNDYGAWVNKKEPTHYQFDFELNESIKVISGPFRGYVGVISEINPEKGKLKSLSWLR